MSDNGTNLSAPSFSSLPAVQNRITDALAIPTGREARRLRRKTNAAVAALAQQQYLASATTACVDEHVKMLGALSRFHDAALVFQVRQDLSGEFYDNQATEERERLIEAEHRRALAEHRRQKEILDAKRQTIESQHSLEATELFKEPKFELGRIRMRARQQDAEIDSKTAEAAVVKIAGELAKLAQQEAPNIAAWIDQRIAMTEVAIEEKIADGDTATELRAELAFLRKLKGSEGSEL
jgi:hypothetical protein